MLFLGFSFFFLLMACSSSHKPLDNSPALSSVTLTVSGMQQVNGFVWMDWPTAIVSALEGLKGVQKAEYKTAEDEFHISYNEKQISLPQIMEKIRQVGKQEGLSYEPQVVKKTEQKKNHADW